MRVRTGKQNIGQNGRTTDIWHNQTSKLKDPATSSDMRGVSISVPKSTL